MAEIGIVHPWSALGKMHLTVRTGAISCAHRVQRKCFTCALAVYFSSDLTIT